MAYTQQDLDRLQAAMARGVRRVEINGETVEYRSIAEMTRVEQKIKADLGLSAGQRKMNPTTKTGWR